MQKKESIWSEEIQGRCYRRGDVRKETEAGGDRCSIQKQHVAEITRRNDTMLFANVPGGANSEMGRKYFEQKQKKALL